LNYLLGSLVLFPAEKILNRLLAQDAHIFKQLRPFSGKVLEIHSSGPSATLRIRFQEQQIRLSSLDADTLQEAADATVAGKTSSLLSLLLNSETTPLANKAITITGDAVFIQDLFTTLRNLDMDWRDTLTPIFGDVLIQELSEAGDKARHWGAAASTNVHRSIDDYIKEEIDLVPAAEEVARFSDDLDKLKLALDRAQARATLLQSRMDKSLKNQQLL